MEQTKKAPKKSILNYEKNSTYHRTSRTTTTTHSLKL